MQNCYPQVIEKSFEIIKRFEEKFGWFSIRVYQFPQIDGFGTFLESEQRTLLRHRTIGWYMWARIRGTVYFFCSWNPDVSAKWSKVQVREKQEKLDFDGMICKNQRVISVIFTNHCLPVKKFQVASSYPSGASYLHIACFPYLWYMLKKSIFQER